MTTWKQCAVTVFRGGTGDQSAVAAIKQDGTLWVWGHGAQGQMGNNLTTSYSSPIQVGSLSNWKVVAGDGDGGFNAIKTDGTLWFWGGSGSGSGGNGGGTSSPVQIGTNTNWRTLTPGGAITAVIAVADPV